MNKSERLQEVERLQAERLQVEELLQSVRDLKRLCSELHADLDVTMQRVLELRVAICGGRSTHD